MLSSASLCMSFIVTTRGSAPLGLVLVVITTFLVVSPRGTFMVMVVVVVMMMPSFSLVPSFINPVTMLRGLFVVSQRFLEVFKRHLRMF